MTVDVVEEAEVTEVVELTEEQVTQNLLKARQARQQACRTEVEAVLEKHNCRITQACLISQQNGSMTLTMDWGVESR